MNNVVEEPMTDKHTTHSAADDVRNRDITIYVNGDLVHRNDAKVSVYDAGFMLGDGMWEGMRLYNGTWAFFDEHMDRLFGSCKAVNIECIGKCVLSGHTSGSTI